MFKQFSVLQKWQHKGCGQCMVQVRVFKSTRDNYIIIIIVKG